MTPPEFTLYALSVLCLVVGLCKIIRSRQRRRWCERFNFKQHKDREGDTGWNS
jgi:hypothetical protein